MYNINNLGQVVGGWTDVNPAGDNAVIYSNGDRIPLGALPGGVGGSNAFSLSMISVRWLDVLKLPHRFTTIQPIIHIMPSCSVMAMLAI